MLDNATRSNAARRAGRRLQTPAFHADSGHAQPVAWLEIHAENYMGDGGRPLAQLRHLSEHSRFRSTALACPSAAKARWTRSSCPAETSWSAG